MTEGRTHHFGLDEVQSKNGQFPVYHSRHAGQTVSGSVWIGLGPTALTGVDSRLTHDLAGKGVGRRQKVWVWEVRALMHQLVSRQSSRLERGLCLSTTL